MGFVANIFKTFAILRGKTPLKSSQTLTEAAFWSQKSVVSMIEKGPHFRLLSFSLEEEEGSIAVVKSAISLYKTIKSGIYDYVNPPSESSRMDPRSEPVKEWELAIGATPGAWQPGRMQLPPLTSDEWKSKLTQLTAQGTGVRIKERGGREKTVGDVKLLNDTLSNWVDTGVALIRRIGSSPLDEAKLIDVAFITS